LAALSGAEGLALFTLSLSKGAKLKGLCGFLKAAFRGCFPARVICPVGCRGDMLSLATAGQYLIW